MLIPVDQVLSQLLSHGIPVKGALHVGAHDCEERPVYHRLGLSDTSVVWIDAIPSKVAQATQRGIPNVYHAVVTDKDNEDVTFHVSNNVQSSSVLPFGTHSREHPEVVYVGTLKQKTKTIDTFLQENGLNPSDYNFWNFDIQGAELLALKGASQALSHADALYLEVNEKELYVGCALLPELDAYLLERGFKRVLTSMTHHGWGDALYLRIADRALRRVDGH
jgi:FkbM family methyltransferase